MKIILRVCAIASVLVLGACDTGPKGSVGFSLPDGDVEQGKANYIALGCNSCHVNDQVPQLDSAEPAVISVTLGGETTHIKTYGELVTSVINPSHRVSRRQSLDVATKSGDSRMTNLNDVMTVTQLIDLVAFVQSSYTLSPFSSSKYPVYWIPESAKASKE